MNKLNLEKMKKITPQALGDQAAYFWSRFFKLFLVIFFLTMITWSGYLWYFNLYRANWTDEEKNIFLNSQSKETELKRDVLERVVQKIDASQLKFNQEVFSGKNIFKIY